MSETTKHRRPKARPVEVIFGALDERLDMLADHLAQERAKSHPADTRIAEIAMTRMLTEIERRNHIPRIRELLEELRRAIAPKGGEV